MGRWRATGEVIADFLLTPVSRENQLKCRIKSMAVQVELEEYSSCNCSAGSGFGEPGVAFGELA